MDENQAKHIFEKYNPIDDVVRCPSSRIQMRGKLDSYATAAVNLYGLIRRDEFVKIFNSQNKEQTNIDEVYTLLLPHVLKNGNYWFYEDYIVHYSLLYDPDRIAPLKKVQRIKQRYIPPKKQFLLFESEEYDDNSYWEDVKTFLVDTFGYDKGTDVVDDFEKIKKYIPHMSVLEEMHAILDRHKVPFDGEEQLQKFIDLLAPAVNNFRTWENKGYTPIEVEKLLESQIPERPKVHRPKKTLPNQPCPCGSGKKYKKCCADVGGSGTAQISYSERKMFYETWYKLLDFVNQKLDVVQHKFSLKYPDYHDEILLHKIREKLWANPELIGEFLRNTDNLSNEEISLLQPWEKHHMKGTFILVKYEPEYAIFMRADKGEDINLYGVKGMTTAIAQSMQLQLPIALETVLLPFGDKIIYDSFMIPHDIRFDTETCEMIESEYKKTRRKSGVILKLGDFES